MKKKFFSFLVVSFLLSINSINAQNWIDPDLLSCIDKIDEEKSNANTPAPLACSISGNATICKGQSTTLLASGGTSYLWSNGATSAMILISPTRTTTYTVTVSNGLLKPSICSQTVTVNPLPIVSISGADSICSGYSTILTASGGSTYLWSNNATTSSITILPTNTATYSVTATSTAGCTSSAQKTVNVSSQSIGGTVTGGATICSGNTCTLSLIGKTGSVVNWQKGIWTANPIGKTLFYLEWINIPGTQGLSSYTSEVLTERTAYRALVKNGACPISYSVSDTVLIAPIPTLTGATQSVAVCAGSVALINLTGLLANTTSTVFYSINGVVQTPITGVVSNASGVAAFSTPILTAANNGQVLQITGITKTNSVPNCTNTFAQNVILNVSSPTIAGIILGDTAICLGDTVGLLTLSGYNGTIIKWQKSISPFNIWRDISITSDTHAPGALTHTTKYRVVVQSGVCSIAYSSEFTITVNANPIVSIGSNSPVDEGFTLNLTSSGGGDYHWIGPNDFVSESQNPTISNMTNFSAGVYTVVVTNSNGCSTSSSDTVKVNTIPITPGGIFDVVLDRFGNEYQLSDLMISKAIGTGSSKDLPNAALLCSPGYFNLYFEQNSGMAGNSQDAIDRRNVICQLFTDISSFIISPLSNPNNNSKVNIWIRDISHVVGNPSSSGVLGMATAFYSVPSGAPSSNGIADNEIWKTINSGIDSYTNVTSPLVGNSDLATFGNFFHGMMAFNFSNPNINWHDLLTANTSTGLYDEYSVVLHEFMHALGFASLIDQNGQSKFGSNFTYYTRYDMFLKTPAPSNQFLITNSGGCPLPNYQFNPLLSSSVLAPNTVTCANQIQYTGSVTQKVYTPSIFVDASSLSHFEDMCHTPNVYADNSYYVMSEAQDPTVALMKRALTTEERSVLCDIGYNVNYIYASPAANASATYGTANCMGLQVVGVNDGIYSSGPNIGAYMFTGSINSNIGISGILNNDYNAVGFDCLQPVIGSGILSASSGNSTTAVQYQPTTSGLHLLRYIPISANGGRGNITYVYVYVVSANCTPSACDLVNNGGFENAQGCGNMGMQSVTVNCWDYVSGSPNIHTRNCNQGCPVPIPSNWNNPPFDTPVSSNGVVNDNLLGLMGGEYSIYLVHEAIQNNLSNSILPNTQYVLSFWARMTNGTWSNTEDNLTHIVFAGSEYPMAPMQITNATPASLSVIHTFQIPNNNMWVYYELPFTTNSSTPNLNYLSIINAAYLDTQNPSPSVLNNSMVIFDNISIKPLEQQITFAIPSANICINQVIDDLNTYTNPNFPGGTFSGAGVVCNGGVCSFNASTAGLGSHTIIYSFTNNLGCVQTEPFDLNVINSSFNISTSVTNNSCSSSCIATASVSIVNGTSPFTYAWNDPSNQSTQTAINLCGGAYTVTVTDANNCYATGNIAIATQQTISNSIINTGCVGANNGSIDITVENPLNPPYSFAWFDGNNNQIATTEDVNNLFEGTYSVSVTDATGCTISQSYVVNSTAGGSNWPFQATNGNEREFGTEIIIDNERNVYAGGFYSDQISFGSYNFSSLQDEDGIYLVKFDPCGNVVWAKSFASDGAGPNDPLQITFDNAWNVIMVGRLNQLPSSPVNLGNGYILSPNTNEHVFVAKFDRYSSNCIMAKKIQGNFSVKDVDVDELDNVYIAGGFGDATIDLGNNITLQNQNPNGGLSDGCIIKYNSLIFPQFASSIATTVTDDYDLVKAISYHNGHLYATGESAGNLFVADVNTLTGAMPLQTTLTYAIGADIKYLDNKLIVAGNYLGIPTNLDKKALICVVDPSTLLISNGYPLYTAGNTNVDCYAVSIVVDGDSHVFVTGQYEGATGTIANFPETSTVAQLPCHGSQEDVFIAKLSLDANSLSTNWVLNSSSDEFEEPFSIAIDNNNWVYVTGAFGNQAIFPYSPPVVLTANYSADVFIVRVNDLGLSGEFKNVVSETSNLVENNNVKVYPNPTKDKLNVEFDFSEKVEISIDIYDLVGRKIKSISKNKLENNVISIPVDEIPSGVYFLNIDTPNGKISKRITVIK